MNVSGKKIKIPRGDVSTVGNHQQEGRLSNSILIYRLCYSCHQSTHCIGKHTTGPSSNISPTGHRRPHVYLQSHSCCCAPKTGKELLHIQKETKEKTKATVRNKNLDPVSKIIKIGVFIQGFACLFW